MPRAAGPNKRRTGADSAVSGQPQPSPIPPSGGPTQQSDWHTPGAAQGAQQPPNPSSPTGHGAGASQYPGLSGYGQSGIASGPLQSPPGSPVTGPPGGMASPQFGGPLGPPRQKGKGPLVPLSAACCAVLMVVSVVFVVLWFRR